MKLSKLLVGIVRHLPIGVRLKESVLFFLKLKYWPDLNNPKTYNEKLNQRKLRRDVDGLISICSDKIGVRDYVEDKIGPAYLVPVLYTGDSITAEALYALGDEIVAKVNHDSNSTYIIKNNTIEEARKAAEFLNKKLKVNFGAATNQFFYSPIRPQVIVEKMLCESDKPVPNDYKIFCFKQPDGSTKKIIEVHQNRNLSNYSLCWYDESGKPMQRSGRSIFGYEPFPKPESLQQIKDVADKLAEDFDHVRVDLYEIDGDIFFGELTFCCGGGRTVFKIEGDLDNELDQQLGEYWHTDTIENPDLANNRTLQPETVEPVRQRVASRS